MYKSLVLTFILTVTLLLSACWNRSYKPPGLEPETLASRASIAVDGYAIFATGCYFSDGLLLDRYLLNESKRLTRDLAKWSRKAFSHMGHGEPTVIRKPYFCMSKQHGEDEHGWTKDVSSTTIVSNEFPYYIDAEVKSDTTLQAALYMFKCDFKNAGENCNIAITDDHHETLQTYFAKAKYVVFSEVNQERVSYAKTFFSNRSPDKGRYYIYDLKLKRQLFPEHKKVRYYKNNCSDDEPKFIRKSGFKAFLCG